ncbi:hypothetical protein KK137_10890 [Croceibacterium sp. LX-88]|uniref:Uncharacterized protein n=1 Tax=Croceibacterium selenioxidans TaxID=2838833 RepID=A0ABS5W518_9SPHN|nr:hypothetical protein [Croceibacterium selenioxidans]MBT2134841.1 hypothetical protein [Croceibacterium selenioxidans]
MSFALAFVAAASIYGTSIEDLRKEFPNSPYDDAIVADAINREVSSNGPAAEGEKSLRENVIPIVVRFPDKCCVVLRHPAFSTGGAPIYCYRLDRDTLIEHFSGGQ